METAVHPKCLGGGDTRYVYSTTHRRNFGKFFVCHIGHREDGGINHFPLCGWRARGMTGTAQEIPEGMKVCGRCARRLRWLTDKGSISGGRRT